jgi:hypothetical protein
MMPEKPKRFFDRETALKEAEKYVKLLQEVIDRKRSEKFTVAARRRCRAPQPIDCRHKDQDGYCRVPDPCIHKGVEG